MSERASRIGVVAIGRNEGERLKRCLRSLAGTHGPVGLLTALGLTRSSGARSHPIS